MTTFVQQTEGVQPVGIGNQRIITPDNSWINTAAGAVDTFLDAAETAGNIYADRTARSAVEQAQEETDRERKEAEDYSKLQALGSDASALDVTRMVSLLEKGVERGQITRENARLRVADKVTSAIQGSPIFEDRIRQSASRLLGFDPMSEAAKQFFGSYEPAGSGSSTNTYETRAQFIAQNGNIGIKAARELVAQELELEARKAVRENKLAIGDMDVDTYLAEASVDDQINGINTMFSGVLAQARNGEEINENLWAQEASKAEEAFVNAMLTDIQASGQAVTTNTIARIRETASKRYGDFLEQVKRFDSGFMNQQNLDRLVTTQKLFGAQAMPVFSTLVNAFGDRIGSQIIDIYADASGNPARLQAIFGASPGLKGFADLLSRDPKGFVNQMQNSLEALYNPNAQVTPDQAQMIDFVLGQVAPTSNPEEAGTMVNRLLDKNMPTKAASFLAKTGAGSATKESKDFMKREWGTMKGAVLEQARSILQEEGASVSVNPDGTLRIVPTRTRGQGSGTRTVSPESSDAAPLINKYNLFLASTAKGWGSVLEITDRTPNQLASELNQIVEVPEVPTRTVQSGRSRFVVDLNEQEQVEYQEYLDLKARQGVQ